MNETSATPDAETRWEDEIRRREEQARVAFLTADRTVLEDIWADGFIVNSPLQQVMSKRRVIEALLSGRIRHTAYDVDIEHMTRSGDVVVVMGRDRVVDPPDGTVSSRRYTNVWQWIDGAWRAIARHAHVVVREPPP
jgi:hypothetical protein